MKPFDAILALFVAVGAFVAFVLPIQFAGCAKASGTITVEVVPSPDGAKCYALIRDDGQPFGGNCK